MPDLFIQNSWLGLAVWVPLYVSDYTLTIICARLYQRGVRDKIAFEGSYELTPYYQRDIDRLRIISPRFLFALTATSIVLFLFRRLAAPSMPGVYLFVLGMLILPELCIHIRHVRNLFLFLAARTDALRGKIEYARRVSLQTSSIELLSFAIMFAVLFAFTGSWFELGGAASCLNIAIKHWSLAKKHVATTAARQEESAAASVAQ